MEDNLFAHYCQEKEDLEKRMEKLQELNYKDQSLNLEYQKKIEILEDALNTICHMILSFGFLKTFTESE